MRWIVFLLYCALASSKIVVDFYFPNELPELDVNVISAGSSFAAQTYQNAIFAYAFVNNDATISYTSLSSSRGLCRVTDYDEECTGDEAPQSDVDFAGSDSIVSSQYSSYQDLKLYPTMAGAVVPVTNLPGLNGTVVFSRQNLVDIFLGTLTSWNDTRLVANQHDEAVKVLLNDTYHGIKVVVRSSKSGTTEIFKSALNAFSPSWAAAFDEQSDAASGSTVWPIENVTRGSGNEGVASIVQCTPYSLGYVVSKVAEDTDLQIGAVGSRNTFVTPNSATVALAVDEKGISFDNPSSLPANEYTASLVAPRNQLAWPIAGYTYLAVRLNTLRPGTTCAYRHNTEQFWLWFWNSGVASDIQGQNGFVSLPENVRVAVSKAFRTEMLCKNETLFSNPVEGGGVDFMQNTMDLLSTTYLTVEALVAPSYHSATSPQALEAFRAQPQGFALVRTSDFGGGLNAPGQVHLPFVGISIIFVFNFCGAAPTEPCLGMPDATSFYDSLGPLALSKEILAQVLDGTIPTWRDLGNALVDAGLEPADGSVNSTLARIPEPIALLGRALPAEEAVILQEIFVSVVPGFSLSPSLQSFDSLDRVKGAVYATPFSLAIIPNTGSVKNNIVQTVQFRHPTGAVVDPNVDSLKACGSEKTYIPRGQRHGNKSMTFHLSESTSDGCYPISEAFNLVMSSNIADTADTEYESNSCGKTATETIEYMYWLMSNADIMLQLESVNMMGLIGSNAPQFLPDLKEAFLSIECDETDIFASNTTVFMDVPIGYKATGIAFASLGMLLTIATMAWVVYHRHTHLVKTSQPLYLFLALFGILVSLSSVFAMALDDKGFMHDSAQHSTKGQIWASRACVSQLVLYGQGTTMVVGALVTKMWRLYRIFRRKNKFEKVVVKAVQVLHVFASILLANAVIILLWQLENPVEWRHVVVETKEQGDGDLIYVDAGFCGADAPWNFLIPLIVLNFLVHVVGNVLCYKLRNVPSEFREGKYISFALFSTFQLFLVGVPVIAIAYDPPNPLALFVLKSGMVLAQSFSQLIIIFAPKVYFMHSNDRASLALQDATSMLSTLRRQITSPRQGSAESGDLGSAEPIDHRVKFSSRRSSNWLDHFRRSSSMDVQKNPVIDIAMTGVNTPP